MGGPFALGAEIFGSFDETDAEEGLPEAVDGDAGGERIRAGDEPAGEIEAVRDGLVLEDAGDAGGDLFAGVIVGTAEEDVGVEGLAGFLHDHDRGHVVEERVAFAADFRDFGPGFGIFGFEELAAFGFFAFGGAGEEGDFEGGEGTGEDLDVGGGKDEGFFDEEVLVEFVD